MDVNGMPLGAPIARGRTAEIYAWREGQVLKLFRDWVTPEHIEYEARIARIAGETGIPTPAAGEIVETNGRFGLVYARVDGPMLNDILRRRPWKLAWAARLLAELHARMHELPAPALPSQRSRLEARIRGTQPLAEDLRQALLSALGRLPDGDRLCHGDFHPENVLLTPGGPVIIDWIDATCGNPLADIARTVILISGGGLPREKVRAWIDRGFRALFLSSYLKRYFTLHPGEKSQLERWAPVVAAARLSEGIAEEQDRLLALARRLA
jgi:Ser/Thr protein kinase RdoA (MazF antagonist)